MGRLKQATPEWFLAAAAELLRDEVKRELEEERRSGVYRIAGTDDPRVKTRSS